MAIKPRDVLLYIGGKTEEIALAVGDVIESRIRARPSGIPLATNFGVACLDIEDLGWRPPECEGLDLDVLVYLIGRDEDELRGVVKVLIEAVGNMEKHFTCCFVPRIGVEEDWFEEFDQLMRQRQAS